MFIFCLCFSNCIEGVGRSITSNLQDYTSAPNLRRVNLHSYKKVTVVSFVKQKLFFCLKDFWSLARGQAIRSSRSGERPVRYDVSCGLELNCLLVPLLSPLKMSALTNKLTTASPPPPCPLPLARVLFNLHNSVSPWRGKVPPLSSRPFVPAWQGD